MGVSRCGSGSVYGKVCSANSHEARCDQYLCSDTLACVNEPSECPCAFTEQVRCELGDSYVCIHARDCSRVQRMHAL